MQKTVVSTPRILPRACGERAYVLLDVSPVRRGDGGLPTHREHPPSGRCVVGCASNQTVLRGRPHRGGGLPADGEVPARTPLGRHVGRQHQAPRKPVGMREMRPSRFSLT